MRIVETACGPVAVRPLTPKQIRKAKTDGQPLRYFGPGVTLDNFEDVRDCCLDLMGYNEKKRDSELTNVEQNKVFSALIAETWGDPGEEKNSPTSGLSDQTATE